MYNSANDYIDEKNHEKNVWNRLLATLNTTYWNKGRNV